MGHHASVVRVQEIGRLSARNNPSVFENTIGNGRTINASRANSLPEAEVKPNEYALNSVIGSTFCFLEVSTPDAYLKGVVPGAAR